jgi:phage-related minor tail protein
LLLNAGINSLAGGDGRGIFSVLNGSFGTRAMGGPVSAGQPYVVGERRPELFVPNQSGHIYSSVPGGQVVYNQTINVTDTGSDSESDAGELGRMIESSVVGIIQREKRPGGLIS